MSDTPQSAIRNPQSLRVLVLEDRPSDAELMMAELRRQGFDADWTRVETEADFVAALDERLDVIVSDFNLPGFDALQAIAHVRRLALTVPVIVVTGAVGEETAAQCIREGAADYLLKDRLARLGLAVSQAIDRRRLADQQQHIESALLASQNELATVFDSAPVAMVIVDGERRVVRANRAASRLAGRLPGDVLGRLPGDAFGCRNAVADPTGCRDDATCQECPLRRVVNATLERRAEQHSVECTLPFGGRNDTDPVTILVSSSPIETPDGVLAVVSLEDITDRQRSRERERRLATLLATIRDINQLIVRETNREVIFSESCRIIVEQAGFPLAWIGEAEHGFGAIRPVAIASDQTGSEILDRMELHRDTSGPEAGPAATAIREGRTVVVNDQETDPGAARLRSMLREARYGSGISLPLVVAGRPFGALTVYGRNRGEFDSEIVELLDELAGDLGFALGALEIAARRDAAEQALVESEKLLRRDLEVREAVADISRCVLEDAIDVPEVARTVLAHARRLTGSEHGFVSEIDPVSGDNVGHTLTEMLEGQCQVAGDDRRIAFPRSPDGTYARLWGYALNTALPFHTNQPSEHPASTGTPGNHVPIERYLAVPVTSEGEVLGEIALANPPRDFTDQDLELVGRLADYYAMALVKSRVEANLADSEERYRSLFEQAPIGIYRTTATGRVVAANPTLIRMLGYDSFDELAAIDVTQSGFASPDGRQTFREAIDPGGEVVGHQAEWRTRDGESVFVRENARAIRDSDGNVLYYEGTVEDITEAHRARRERDLLYDLAVDMFCISGFDGRLRQLNPAWQSNLGWSLDELCSKSFLSFVHPDDRENALAAYAELDAGRTVLGNENRVRCRDGSFRWLSWNAHPLPDEGLVVAVAHDTTERRRAEQDLKESEQRYREFFEDDLTADFITELDGTLIECNPAYMRIFGFADKDEARATNVAELYATPAGRSHLLARLNQSGGRLAGVELELQRQDGSPLFVIGNLGLVTPGDGGRPRIKGYLFDITERRELEEQLRQSQKMEAVGRLAGGVAHDFNNLLQALLSQTQLVRTHHGDADHLRAITGEIEQQVRRGAALTRQLLLFSRRETTQLSDLDLNQVIRDQVALLRRLIRANITLDLELAPETLPIIADHGQLEQVLMNLVVNASDVLPAGGRITIRSGLDGESTVWLSVEDDGPGVPEGLRAKIFEPFFTTKAAAEGTGLGLSVVHGIVTLHGADISVGDRPGGGAVFTVSFPRTATTEGAIAESLHATPPEVIRGRHERVLVVEDEAPTREALTDLLEALDYDVVAAGSAEEVTSLPDAPSFDVLLTDMMLPGASGPELAAVARRRWPELKVLLMSGYNEDEIVRRGVDAGTVRFLQKPFDMRTLAAELRAALDEDVCDLPG